MWQLQCHVKFLTKYIISDRMCAGKYDRHTAQQWQRLFILIASIIGLTEGVRNKGCSIQTVLPDRYGEKLENGRLPGTLAPYHQVIDILPDIYQPLPPFEMSGHVDIFFHCLEATDVIYINSIRHNLDADSIVLEVAPESPIQPDPPNWLSFETDDNMQFLIVYLGETMVEGAQYRLSFDFNGTMVDPGFHSSGGLYWDWYNVQGEIRWDIQGVRLRCGSHFRPTISSSNIYISALTHVHYSVLMYSSSVLGHPCLSIP